MCVLVITIWDVSVQAPDHHQLETGQYKFPLHSHPDSRKILVFSPASGRLSDGAAVPVPWVGVSSGSARLQTLVSETDTAGGKMARGMRGRGRPDDHPLLVSRPEQLALAIKEPQLISSVALLCFVEKMGLKY